MIQRHQGPEFTTPADVDVKYGIVVEVAKRMSEVRVWHFRLRHGILQWIQWNFTEDAASILHSSTPNTLLGNRSNTVKGPRTHRARCSAFLR